MKSQTSNLDIAIRVLLVIIAVLILAICGTVGIGYMLDKKDGKPSSTQGAESDSTASLGADKDLGNVLTGTVDITVPASMLGEDFDYTLTDENKSDGFTKIEKNSDGSATYTIKKKDYKEFIEELKLEIQKSFDSLVTNGDYPSIKDIEYSESFDVVTIIADKTQFESGFDSVSMWACGLLASMYQSFDVDVEIGCTVNVKDSASGEIFKTATYPQ